MAASTEQLWKFAQRVEKEIHAVLIEKDPSLPNIEHLISKFRLKCQDIILQDFEYALSNTVEARLWETHVKTNNRFRKSFSSFREAEGRKKPVEQRKATKVYLDFIKSSQRFYRGYIQRLASHFGGIHELEAVAHKFSLDALPIGKNVQLPAQLRHEILLSCHQTLVRLGDLSRYRETEIVTKERNWGPAIGYYDLAGAIYPASGASHNQLAVIALSDGKIDGNHLRATYHLYRALAAEEPHPSAGANLELEFKKIETAKEKGELITNSLQREIQGPGKALLGWFVLLHARCYKGIDFAGHDELENEVLTQLTVDLKERSLEGSLNRFVLINIAAEYYAAVRLRNDPESKESLQAYFFFQRLNVKTFFTLLQVLQPELERSIGEEEEVNSGTAPTRGSEKTTAVARRVLPGLRQYSSWLVSNAPILIAQVGDTSLSVQVKELWKTYANTLTLLALTFPAHTLPSVDYLLEEDEDTLGFKPFENQQTKRRYFHEETDDRKPKWHDQGVERYHPNAEMVGRVRDFLTDGLELALDETIPIDFIEGTNTFTYREEGMPSELFASPEGHQATLSSISIDREDISQANGSGAPDMIPVPDERDSQAASAAVSMTTDMNRMVDNLVSSEATDDSEIEDAFANASAYRIPPTPPERSFDDSPSQEAGNETSYGLIGTLTAQDLVRDLHAYSPQQQTPRPVLPSIYNSPFAPQAGEEISRPSTAKRTPHHSQRSSQNAIFFQQQPNHQSIPSTISSMQDLSSMAFPPNPWEQYDYAVPSNGQPLGKGHFGPGATHATSRLASALYGDRNGTAYDESNFKSSNIFEGSDWPGSAFSGREALDVQTPPNGQGGG